MLPNKITIYKGLPVSTSSRTLTSIRSTIVIRRLVRIAKTVPFFLIILPASVIPIFFLLKRLNHNVTLCPPTMVCKPNISKVCNLKCFCCFHKLGPVVAFWFISCKFTFNPRKKCLTVILCVSELEFKTFGDCFLFRNKFFSLIF